MSRKQRPQDTGPLRILLTNSFISNWSGSELYIRDLALELKKRGHLPIAYSTRLGKLAQELRALSIPVVDDLNAAGAPPDLIHGQHHLETMTALLHFPGVPAVYFCHGWLPWEEIPPPATPRLAATWPSATRFRTGSSTNMGFRQKTSPPS